jgi:RimJ/RimL family protein N-acetyltransferase
MNHSPVFDGQQLRLTPMDISHDPPVLARWSADLEVARRLRSQHPVRPLAEFEAKKVLEDWLKEIERSNRVFMFGLRPQGDDRLAGYIRISQVMWVHGAAQFDLVIGDPQDWERYAGEALSLGLRYAFDEMNLFRITVQVEEHNVISQALYQAAQFFLEVRQRQVIYHEGRYWDRLMFGMLRPEWSVFQNQQLGVAA